MIYSNSNRNAKTAILDHKVHYTLTKMLFYNDL